MALFRQDENNNKYNTTFHNKIINKNSVENENQDNKIIIHKDIKKSGELSSIATKISDIMESIDINFVQLGPTVIPNGQRHGGKSIQITGRVSDIAIDDNNSDIIWVATS